MPGAQWVINQPSGAGSGTPGVSRDDLYQNQQCQLAAVSPGGTSSFLWELLYKPAGSASALSATNIYNPTITLDTTTESYRIRLTTNGGGLGNVSTMILCATKNSTGTIVNRGWRIPAFQEQATEGNFAGNLYGYDPDYTKIIYDILGNASFVGGPSGWVLVNHAASPYVVQPADLHLSVDSSAGVVVVELPVPTTMRLLEIKDSTGSALTNNITLTPTSGLVDGAASLAMSVNWQSVVLRGNGTNWEVV